MQERMLEVALRAAVLHDAAGRTLRSLGDLVGSLTPADQSEPTGEPPALAADLALADAVSSLLSGPHAAASALSVVMPEGDRATYSARDVFATLAAALAHSTLHDPLTGLPTRRWVLDEVDRRLAGATPAAPVGVLQVELGQLKDINDSLGYELGDALIKEAARRLVLAIGPNDAVGRLVGDEFAILLGDLSADDPIGGAAECARRVLDLLAEGVRLGDHELQMQASVGVCVVDGGAISAEHVLRRADSAMTRAKVSGRGRAELYDPNADRPVDRLSLTLRLREALAADAFSLHFQPIHRLRDGALVGAEALVRWQDETGRWVPPDEFIPYAETVGLIVPIGAMVLDAAARQAGRWQARGLALPVSVNLSPHQIVGSDLVGEVRAALGRHNVAPSMLRLELTETAAVTDFPTTRQRLAELRDLGVGLSLDDFGTGYSSLKLLRELAVDDVKVDRSFVGGLDVNGADAAMVRLVVETSHALGLTVTAEGVERPDQLAALAELGCDSVQGFLLGRPVRVADFDVVGDAARALCEPATARAAANA
ncbi:MAG TPA: bifunctional diguanylate cyclase/phosphodiesterase [Mycobacteriales bacterium]|nr:bifunctional diguanylate cyclase/phosphodiesterase [Mycobacteriales bacterium]